MLRRVPFLLLMPIVLNGCMLSYVVRSGYNQAQLLMQRVPVDEVLRNPKTPSPTKQKLRLALEAREFAERELKLRVSKNYTSYVDIKRPYVTYIVQAAPAFELQPHLWSFPIVGELPYKGFFDRDEALAEAKKFPAEQYDTYVRGVTAYSTLGWFNDPLLSTMIDYQDHQFVNLVLHETVHATLYISGNADFNERLATFLANKGTELFYQKKQGHSQTANLQKIRNEMDDDGLFSEFITNELSLLEQWYNVNKGYINHKLKKERINQIITRFEATKPLFKTEKYLNFSQAELNNAILLSYKTYLADLSDFEKAFSILGNDFQLMLKFCKSLEQSEDPALELKKYVNAQI